MKESIEVTAFLLGPVAGAVVLPIWWAMVMPAGWRHLSMPSKIVGLGSAVLFVGYWTTWWFGSDWVDGEPVPNGLSVVSGRLMLPLAAASLLLLNGCVTLNRSPAQPNRSRRSRR